MDSGASKDDVAEGAIILSVSSAGQDLPLDRRNSTLPARMQLPAIDTYGLVIRDSCHDQAVARSLAV